MSWGSTIKSKVLYNGKIFNNKAEMDTEYIKLGDKINEYWEKLSMYIFTCPKDYVDENDISSKFDTYSHTLETIKKDIRKIESDINNCIMKQAKIIIMEDEIDTYKYMHKDATDKDIDNLYVHYGNDNLFIRIINKIIDKEDNYGTSMLCSYYFSRMSLSSECEVENTLSENNDNVRKWWRNINTFIFSNPKDFIIERPKNKEDEDYESECYTLDDVLLMLQNKIDEYREMIEEDQMTVGKLLAIQEDKESYSAFWKEKEEKRKKKEEFDKQKDEILSKICSDLGVDKNNWYWCSKYEEINKIYTEKLKEAGLDKEEYYEE